MPSKDDDADITNPWPQDLANAVLRLPDNEEQRTAHEMRRKYYPHGPLERMSESMPWKKAGQGSDERVQRVLSRSHVMAHQPARQLGVLSTDDIITLQEMVDAYKGRRRGDPDAGP